MLREKQQENINNSFFDGYYKEIWRSTIPEALTSAELAFLIEEGNLNAKSRVLDLMCGYGRHALGLAEKGVQVTAVDNLPAYITEIDQLAKKNNLPIRCYLENVLKLKLDSKDKFDMAICMGNSISFFDHSELEELFSKVSSHMNPGGKFIINTLMLAEIAFNGFRSKQWSYILGFKYLTESTYIFNPPAIKTDTFMISEKGTVETKHSIDFIYTIAEMEKMFNEYGFELMQVYSIPSKKIFNLGDPRAYLIGRKKIN